MSEWILVCLLLALLLDRVIGDPPLLWSKVPHPVVLFGSAISWFDRRLNKENMIRDRRRANGVVAILALLLLAVVVASVLQAFFALFGPLALLLEILVVAILLAQKSLADHVMAVVQGLRQDGIEGGRQAVSMIVGRDPRTLDESGVSRAAIESLSENFADGVVAPAFWYLLAGLPGILAYKMLNTADSMIGHKSPKYIDFGWASARLDDLANWPAARLSALMIAFGALVHEGRAAARRSLSVAMRDSRLHRSPNSGWPEAAMAGALDLQLAGPRIYAGETVNEPMINGAGRPKANHLDIQRAIRVFHGACTALTGLVALLLLISLLV